LKKATLFLYNNIMKYTVLQEPYKDNDIEFDKTVGLYVLTKNYAKANFEITYRDDSVLGRRLKKISRAIHYYILWKTIPENKQVVDFFLHKTKEGVMFLKEVMTSALEADLESGYYSLSQQAPIEQGIDREMQRINRVDVQTEDIICNSESYLGFNLFVQFPFPFAFFNFVQNNLN